VDWYENGKRQKEEFSAVEKKDRIEKIGYKDYTA
jgi:hypothetical protein